MADSQRDATLRLRFEIARSGTREAQKVLDQLKADYRDLAAGEARINTEAVKSSAAVVRSNEQIRKSVMEVVQANEDLTKSYKDSQAISLAGSTNRALGGVRQLASTAGLSGVSQGLGIGGDIIELAEDLPRLKESITGIPQAAKDAIAAIGAGNVGMIGGIAAATLAIKLFTDQANAAKDAARAQINAQTEYFSLVSTGTTESLSKERDAAAERVKAAQAAADHAKLINDRLNQDLNANLDPISRAVLDFNTAIGTGGGELKATQQAVDDTNKELVAAQAQLGLYTRALQDGQVAANDAAIAEAKLAAERQRLTDQLAETQISTLTRAASQSSDAANQRLAAIRNEIEVTQRFLDQGGLSAEKTAELTNKITLLGQEMVTLNVEVLPLIQAREREAAAIAYQKKQIEDTAKAVETYNSDVARIEAQNLEARQALNEKFNQKVIDLAQQAADSAAAALRDLQKQRADLDRDLGRDLSDAERDRQREELDAMIAAQREDEKAAREHVKNLKAIQREFNRDSTNAIADRDAVALSQAEQKRNDSLRDEQDNYRDSANERRIAFQQEATDRRVAFDRDRQDRLLKYQRDQADALAAYNAEIALNQQKHAQELARAQAAYQQDLQALNQKYTQELTLRKQAAAAEIALISQTEATRARIILQTQAALIAQAKQLAGGYGSANTPTQDTGTVIPFARGGNAPGGRTLLVGERGPELVRFRQPSRIYSASQTRQMGGGRSMTVMFEGATRKTITAESRAEAESIFGALLDDMGA